MTPNMTPTQDETTPVAALKHAVRQFRDARHWEPYHSPKNLAMSIAIEAAELMELFQWVDDQEALERAQSGAQRDRVAEELADVMIYCLSMAVALDLDVSAMITRKLKANERKYPVGGARTVDPTRHD